ncbi:MAG TPA: hypothetical protein VJ768_09130, partial [Anaerolineales bacterium]|nr:hypothetical protein [Anaerolineales bacterium]
MLLHQVPDAFPKSGGTLRAAERICLYPRLSSTGGPAAFQEKFALGLRKRGIDVCFDLNDRPYRSVLLIGGTRRLGDLRRARRSGVPVIQRLDGMNWIHRRRRTGLAHFLRAEYGNLNLSYIRRRLADRIVYQSQFARHWWEGKSGLIEGPSEVIYNGVDLGVYNPDGPEAPPSDRWRILLVEGSLAGGYEVGLENAAELVRKLQPALRLPAELVVAGAVPEEVRARLDRQADTQIEWAGQLPKDRIP